MTTPATWAIGADQQSAAALTDAREAIAQALTRRSPPVARPLVFEDALREILEESLSRVDRHAEFAGYTAAVTLARVGDEDSLALVKRWAEIEEA